MSSETETLLAGLPETARNNWELLLSLTDLKKNFQFPIVASKVRFIN